MSKGEWTASEGLVLRHGHTGQRLFAVHGHQIDFWCDQLSLLTQQIVWSARRGQQRMSRAVSTFALPQRRMLINFATSAWERWYANQQQKQTQQMINWVKSRRQPAIVGHTHLPLFPNGEDAPCFNTGSCINPGYLTGIEIQGGLLRFVKWVATGSQRYQYTLLAPARPLTELRGHNATSVYTPAMIFPMLPEKLSTDLTSLNFAEERLAVVVEMVIGMDGSLLMLGFFNG